MQQYDPDDDEWSGTFRALGYEWCRPCAEWHRPPECWIDSGGRSRLDLMIMNERDDPTMNNDQPDEYPPGIGGPCIPHDDIPEAAPRQTIDPDKPCYHLMFDASVQIARVGEADANNTMPGMPTAFVAEITIKCGDCGEHFKFDGVPAGLSYDSPSTSVDGRELRAPIRPESLPPRRQRIRGRALSGYSIEATPGADLGEFDVRLDRDGL